MLFRCGGYLSNFSVHFLWLVLIEEVWCNRRKALWSGVRSGTADLVGFSLIWPNGSCRRNIEDKIIQSVSERKRNFPKSASSETLSLSCCCYSSHFIYRGRQHQVITGMELGLSSLINRGRVSDMTRSWELVMVQAGIGSTSFAVSETNEVILNFLQRFVCIVLALVPMSSFGICVIIVRNHCAPSLPPQESWTELS